MGPLAFPLFIFLIAPCTSLILISASAFSNTLTFIPGLAVISALPLSLTFNSPSKYSFHLSHTSVPFDNTRPLSSFTHSSFTSVPFLALFTSLQSILLFVSAPIFYMLYLVFFFIIIYVFWVIV